MYKLIIAGSRTFDDYGRLDYEVKNFIVNEIKSKDVTIISGTAYGADRMGEQFAEKYNLELIKMPANWNDLNVPIVWIKYNRFGKPYNAAAGHIRNEEMAKIATHCILFYDGKSKGTANMIENCKKYELNYKIIEC